MCLNGRFSKIQSQFNFLGCTLYEKDLLNSWQRANYNLHQFFGDCRLQVEKPAAIMDDSGYTTHIPFTILW